MLKIIELFWRFLLLGFVSFGGPAAHIGYFRTAFVEKLKWLDDKAYANLIALSQFLPGPSSSQVGFAIGLNYGGLGGAIAAFFGFTLPSFLLLYLLAVLDVSSAQSHLLDGMINGLKLFAVVVVADAIYGMYKSFCKDFLTKSVALMTAFALLFFATLFSQILVLLLAALIGMVYRKKSTDMTQTKIEKPKKVYLILFFAFLFLVPIFSALSHEVWLFSAFYEAGSLVFGGGHVVLPLLQQTVGDSLSHETFLVGYAAAQAVPGPMFSLASYLGASILNESPFIGSLIAVIAIFLPGFLLILAFKDSWESFAKQPKISGAVYGVNASVVGLLTAAFIHPISTTAIHGFVDVALAIGGFVLLRVAKIPVYWLIVIFCIVGIIA